MPFDAKKANRACRFIESLPQVKGRWAGGRFKLMKWQREIVRKLFGTLGEDGLRQYRTLYLEIPRKNGKMLDLETPVPVPSGWTTIGALRVGDELFDDRGEICRVTHLTPVDPQPESYQIEFSNGEVVRACADHLWLTAARVDTPGARSRAGIQHGTSRMTRVRTTREIYETQRYGARGDTNHSLAVSDALELPEARLAVDPYVLGLWLGDGTSSCAQLTVGAEDVECVTREVESAGYATTVHDRGGASTVVVRATRADLFGALPVSQRDDENLQRVLRDLGVLGSKHIPAPYLRASRRQRLALLQGLMDSDGTISKNGRVLAFCTTSRALMEGAAELLATLGVKFSALEGMARIDGRAVGPKWSLQFMAFRDELPAFRLPRKIDRMRRRADCRVSPRSQSVQITAVEPCDPVPMRCLAVDSPSRLFRIGRTMLPTHNTTLAAAIALYLLFADGEMGGEIYGAASDRDQASLVFDIAAEMVRRTPELARRAQIVEYKKRIVHPKSASFYRAIPRDAAGSHGFNASGIVFDELHTQSTPDLHDVLTTSTGTREEPLIVEITTSGFDRTTICYREHDHARKVIEGVIDDPTFLGVIYSATKFGENEEDVDWQDEALWHQANPALGEFLSLDYMREKAKKAESDPAFLNVFKRLHLNIWTQAETRYISGEKWDACRGEFSDEDLVGRPCWAGLDAASKTDLAAFLLVFDLGDRVAIRPHFWIPRDTIIQRSRDDGVPYATWHDMGLVTATAGNWIDYDTIERDVLAAHDKYQIRELGYDPWDVTQMVQHFEGEGIKIVPVRQGFQSLNPPTKELLRLILSGELLHDGNPIMRWNMDNLMVEPDAAGNVKPSKKASTEKIDGMVALIIAISRMMGQEAEEESVYNDPDHRLLVIS